jgi:hypothetical protein
MMDTSTSLKNIKKLAKILGKWIPGEHHQEHSGQSLSTTLHSFPIMVGTILRLNNSVASSRIRPKSISISRNYFKGRDSLHNLAIFGGSIQAGT